MDHLPPAVLPAVIGEDVLYRQAVFFVEGQYLIVEHVCGRLGELLGIELPEGIRAVGIDHRLEIDPPHAFDGAHHEGVLAQEISGLEALHLSLPEAGVCLLDEPDLLFREVYASPFLFELEDTLVPRFETLLDPDVPYRRGAHRDPLQSQLIRYPHLSP